MGFHGDRFINPSFTRASVAPIKRGGGNIQDPKTTRQKGGEGVSKYHLVSTALNPLWIGLFLANLAGAIAYLWVAGEHPYEIIKEIGSGIIFVYIIFSLFFFLFTVPLMYSSLITG